MRSSGSRKLLYHANIINLEERDSGPLEGLKIRWGQEVMLRAYSAPIIEIGLTDLPKFGVGGWGVEGHTKD